MGAQEEEEVKVVETCIVKPSEETPQRRLWLSPLDLVLVNRGHTPTVYFYRAEPGSGSGGGFFDVARMKAAMAKALVAFYPLAGRLSVDGNGRPEIDCASQGAIFVVAHSDLTVDDFIDFQPSPELRRLFVPRVIDESPSIMCAIQVTFLKCGGVAFGTALHHVATDAIGAFHFLQTWAALSKDGEDGALEERPCHDRTLLRARSPPVVNPDVFSAFCPKLNLSKPSGSIVSEIFVISKDQVAALKRACGRVSTFCAMSAHVWRCMCIARRLSSDATTRLTFPANVRRSLKPPLPVGYFGNGIIWLGTASKVKDITSMELASVAGQVRGAVRRMDDELVHSAIDYFEMAEMDSKPAPGSMPETELRVISWLGMPAYDVDFGWGKPLVMLRAVSERAGFVYLMDGAQGDGSVRMVVCAEDTFLKDFSRLLYANLQNM
ncbi:putrescine hydroxycinnamoyltransferase 1 [Brachypodium distachyon]|uniref:Uncharacterized protein n=1 Tax=Brachypodium distachyon TaxID=15368 RepID=I1HV90_BRADI|nr:putrescine hydroxycinnamoyltransferase 1 [Brachypodium distachyon]KQK11566.1 hypothetical protein BRADI_2g60898v3 [Brachypodium distachyon]|eukprot:XP_003565079.1 putrescine hydroxycinnamoyltransferase 1 [Brachypodium distachyon]